MESFAVTVLTRVIRAAYALISYQTAYLKAHYPVEYMCAFLSSVIEHQDKVVFYIKECQRLGIPLLPPDINESLKTSPPHRRRSASVWEPSRMWGWER
jgi:DNA polymerase-3 subunit alpha